jgi:hypothetical protein
LFSSVQKFICDILGNGVAISINQALESIHPVDKTVSIISIKRPVKISSTTSHNSFPHDILSVQAGFSDNRKKSDGAISGQCGGCGVRLIGKNPISLGLPLPCESLHCPYESKSKVCEFFEIWLHFLSEWTKHFFTNEW